MQKSTYRWQLIVSLICVVFVVTACFRAGIDEAQPNAVSLRVTDEPTVLPTDIPTDLPTETPTVEPTVDVAEATVQVVAAVDTNTPTPTATDTPTSTSTNTPTPTATETEVFVAQSLFSPTPEGVVQGLDPFQLTATELVASATFGAGIPLTQTAIFLQGPIASATPFPTQNFGTDGGTFATPFPTQNFATDGGINLNGQDCVHEVRRGDNLFRISLYYGLTINEIATYSTNNITNPNVISLGQRIIIPGCGTTPGLPPPTSTPGPNGFNTPITGGCTRPYTVQQGDTLFRISLRCGVSVLDLQYANRIINPNYIDIGTVLTIP